MARRDGSVGYYVAFISLVAGLGVAASLTYLLIARPVTEPAGVEVSAPVGEECPVGERAPVCYRFEVTNTGDETGTFACQTIPPTDSAAVFLTGEPRTALILTPAQTDSLLVKVTPLGSDVVGPPGLTCDPPPA